MSDFELPEQRGWAVYVQSARTGEWRTAVEYDAYYVAQDEAGAHDFASESQRVEEVTIRPVCLGADPVQWAAVQMAMALFDALYTIAQYCMKEPGGCDCREFPRRMGEFMYDTFGGSLEREP